MGYPTVPGSGGDGNATTIQGITVDVTGIAAGNALLYDGASFVPAGTESGLGAASVGSDKLAPDAALDNVGIGGLPASHMEAGAAASNLGSPAGALSGSWPNPTLASGAVSSHVVLAADTVRGTKIDPSNTYLVNLLMQGKNGAGACTLTGAAVGDKVLVVGFAYGTPTAANPAWETTITVGNQLQQGGAIDASAAFYSVLLQKRT